MILFAAAILWILGGIVHHQTIINRTKMEILREMGWDDCDFATFAWRYTWVDACLGPLLLLRKSDLWGTAMGSLYASLPTVEEGD